jgi:poly[(R)-3-hydroxyalkanoate] polymerase subunit PhaC
MSAPSRSSLPGFGRLPGRERLAVEARRSFARGRNTLKYIGDVDPPLVAQTPKDLVWARGRCELWRYRSDLVTRKPPLLFVFSLVSRSYIVDLQPGNSFIEHLQRAGFDVFLLDWAPADELSASERLEDYADDYLPEAVKRTCEITGSGDVNLLGYCFSGVINVLYAAHHQDAPLRSMTNIATPIDFSRWEVWKDMLRPGRIVVDDVVDRSGNIPPSAIRQAFRLLKPTNDVRLAADWLENSWDDHYVVMHRTMTRWANDHVPFPGELARQCVDMLVTRNGFIEDRLWLGGERVSLRNIRAPALTVIAERDHLIPEPVAGPLPALLGSKPNDTLRLDAGHIGLVIGRKAAKVTIPKIISFLHSHSDKVAPREKKEEGTRSIPVGQRRSVA